ncbi:MAG: hypothetical protein M5R36_03365 [Deltaproteobacteria bacterium]|nr:hypothetical protein [Deltaproteobacteria bacterium]
MRLLWVDPARLALASWTAASGIALAIFKNRAGLAQDYLRGAVVWMVIALLLAAPSILRRRGVRVGSHPIWRHYGLVAVLSFVGALALAGATHDAPRIFFRHVAQVAAVWLPLVLPLMVVRYAIYWRRILTIAGATTIALFGLHLVGPTVMLKPRGRNDSCGYQP